MHVHAVQPVARVAALVVTTLAVLGGCQTSPTVEPDGDPMSYAAVRRQYNVRTQRIEQMWTRSVVEVRWEHEGRKHFEQGDGPLIIRKPHELALSIGKLGNTMIWLGGDADRFWLFNLNPPKGEPTTAYVGRQLDVGKPGMDALPIPVRPDQLLELLGVTDLPDAPAKARRTDDGDIVVTLDRSNALGRYQHVYVIDADDMTPKSITYRSGDKAHIVAKLSNYKPLKIAEKPPGAWPRVPARIEITAPTEKASMTLFLGDPIDGAEKIRDTQFDFDRLVRALKPEKVVHLKPR